MRFRAKSALLFGLLPMAVASGILAQGSPASSNAAHRVTGETSAKTHKATLPRLLTSAEGLAILGAALDSRHHPADSSPDCSHLVHWLYERAGFPYEYASSSDLYAGVEEFQRVTNPQPGDLAVWPGHTGIVVNPAQYSFYSALRSGHGVDSYDSPYWKQRGRPRFFRYVKAADGGVLSASARSASLRRAALGTTEAQEVTEEEAASDSSEVSPTEARISVPAKTQPLSPEILRIAVVNSARPKPDGVGAAFLSANNGWADSFQGGKLFHLGHPVIVFDHFEVKKVHITGDQGWAEVEFREPVSVVGSKAEAHKRVERQRWPLRRRNSTSWELMPATNTIYLPSPIAVRMLAHEVATLTEDFPDAAGRTPEKAELARLLDVLLSK